MNPRKVDLNLFLVFDTIYTERNLTQAARVLSISQPAVSNALARLRKLYDDQLFVRSARGMVPTPVAERIAQPVSQALSLMRGSVAERGDFDPRRTPRTYQLSLTDLAEAVILPRLMPHLERDAPAVALQSYYTGRKGLVRQLARGELDFAVDVPVIEDDSLCHESLLSDAYVCAVGSGHPVAGTGLTMEQYLSLEHIHVSSRRKGMGQVDLALRSLDVERHIKLRVQHFRVAASIAEETDLVLTIPGFLAAQYDLRILSPPFTVPPLELHLYWYRHADGDPSHRWLRRALMGLFT